MTATVRDRVAVDIGNATWCDVSVRSLLPEVIDDLTDTQLSEIYNWPTADGTSWLRANFAATIDGAVTDATGLSEGVSSPDDKRVFALLRATCDVVLVGAGTARAEGYGPVRVRESMSEIRRLSGRSAPPRLVVISKSAALDPGDAMFTDADPSARTIVVTVATADQAKLNELRDVSDVWEVGHSSVDLREACSRLRDLGLQRLLCEGGPTLFADLLSAELVNDLCLTTSPLIAGRGRDSKTLTGDVNLSEPRNAQLGSLVQADNTLLARWLIAKDVS